MNEFASKEPDRTSELESILNRLIGKNEDWARLTGDLQTGLQKISRYSEPEDPRTNPSLKNAREDTIIERLKEQLEAQDGYISRLEFSLRHLRTIV